MICLQCSSSYYQALALRTSTSMGVMGKCISVYIYNWDAVEGAGGFIQFLKIRRYFVGSEPPSPTPFISKHMFGLTNSVLATLYFAIDIP